MPDTNNNEDNSKKSSTLSKSIAHAIAASDDEAEIELAADVVQLSADKVKINQDLYNITINHGNQLDTRRLARRYNTVLRKYDYIVGDWGYGQLRLRGFYDDIRPQAKIDQKISTLQDYLLEYCNFGCAYFVLEREQKEPVNPTKRTVLKKKSSKNHRHRSTTRFHRRKLNELKKTNTAPKTKVKPTTNTRNIHKKVPFKIRNLK